MSLIKTLYSMVVNVWEFSILLEHGESHWHSIAGASVSGELQVFIRSIVDRKMYIVR